MAEWWSIEVFHADLSARQWKSSYENALIEAALTHGALNWVWHEHRTGVVLELEFPDDAAWETYRNLPAVRAILSDEQVRVWRLYLAGGALAFEEGRMGVDQILAVRPQR